MRRREAGQLVILDPGADKPLLEAATLQCVHCGGHWIVVPGSKRVRGYCMNCNGPICGPDCQTCVPVEQLLENMERGKPPTFRRIVG